MTVLTQHQPTHFAEARKLGRSAFTVYAFLWDQCNMDDCTRIFNTSNWTIKGLAGELMMSRNTVNKAIDKLIAGGFIGISGRKSQSNGSNSVVWAIYRADWIPNVKHALSVMPDQVTRLHQMRKQAKKVQLETPWLQDI